MQASSIRTAHSPRRNRHTGFTLIEAALVTIIVGVGVLAIVQAEQSYHQQNNFSQHIGTALLLANEIRELTLNMPQHDPITGTATWGPESNEHSVVDYDDLDDFDGTDGQGVTFSPPIDAMRQEIPNMAGWSQKVTVVNVLPNYLSSSAPAPDDSTDVVRITCQVFYQSPRDEAPVEITRLSWIRAGAN
ncbi:MAG: hypothetical protein GC162_12210 [Planctomycetes bacterium]|nr:hypothetical protein [Planctomycetota bacterium]